MESGKQPSELSILVRFGDRGLGPGSKPRTSVTGRFSKVGTAVALLLAVGAICANAPELNALDEPTSIAGTVRDGRGVPQAGAMVELLRPDTSVVASVFTDEYGRFLLAHLIPGTYSIKATGTLFLPTLRENLQVLAHRRTSINLTLSTVMEAFQWLPAKRRSVDEPDDEWAWTLRSAANRPLLRMLEDGPLVVVSDMDTAPVLKARVILRGGANEFGEGGLHNAFEIERSKQDDRRLILRADIGSSDMASVASAETLVGYERQLTMGNTIRTVAAMQDLPGIEQTSNQQGIQSMVLRSAQTIELTPFLDAEARQRIRSRPRQHCGVRESSLRNSDLAWWRHCGFVSPGYSPQRPGCQRTRPVHVGDANRHRSQRRSCAWSGACTRRFRLNTRASAPATSSRSTATALPIRW